MQKNEFEYAFKFIRTTSNHESLWKMKTAARESLRQWLTAINAADETRINAVSNAVSELVENAIKYSIINSESFVSIQVNAFNIVISTINRTEPSNVKKIKEIVDKINRINDINTLFLEQIQNISQQGTGSQLGLIKIRMETGGLIELISSTESEELAHFKVSIDCREH